MNNKNILISIVFVIGVAVIGLWGVDFSAGYQSVSEVVSSDHNPGESVNVMGSIKAGSLNISTETIIFILQDNEGGSEEIQVEYTGDVPANLVEGQDITITGTIVDHGHIEASKIIIGCPSRYTT